MSSGPPASLERYLDATAVSPPPDLVGLIGARLLLESPSTAPRRFFAALRALDTRGILRGLAQNAGTAFRPGSRSMLLRAQAMAIVLVTLATVGFGSVASLAATHHVAQQVVDRLEGRPDRGSITSPAAPTAPVGPPAEQLEALRADQLPGDPGAEGKPGSVEVPGQACGLPAHAEADHLQASDAERCPDGPATARPARDEGRPGIDTGDKGKADPPASKASDKGTTRPHVSKWRPALKGGRD
ncbi:MAG: hypothetical protein R6W93_06805 [Candidatus Limnocylindrales bacterium]